MKKVLILLLALVMTECLVNLNSSSTKAEDNATPLTFTCLDTNACAIEFAWSQGSDVQYKTTGTATPSASDWAAYTKNTTITLYNGDTISFRANNIKTLSGANNHFAISGNTKASGDVTSLTNGIGGDVPLNISGCYDSMFYDCSGLITAPNLPSTTLSNGCYYQMFGNTSIVEAPLLPATTLAQTCYSGMFINCDSLTTLPVLPATTLTNYCYEMMFNDCDNVKVSLTQDAEYLYSYRIPTNGTGIVGAGSVNSMFGGTGGSFTGNPSINTTLYTTKKPIAPPEPPQPEPTPSQPKDESCEKVIGPTWHWNNDKGICEEYATVGTSTR